jgi:hypothetical protein
VNSSKAPERTFSFKKARFFKKKTIFSALMLLLSTLFCAPELCLCCLLLYLIHLTLRNVFVYGKEKAKAKRGRKKRESKKEEHFKQRICDFIAKKHFLVFDLFNPILFSFIPNLFSLSFFALFFLANLPYTLKNTN